MNNHNTLHIKIYTKHARIGKICIKINWSLGSDQSSTWSGIQKPYTCPSHVWNHLLHSHKHSTQCNWHNTSRSSRIEEESSNMEEVRSPMRLCLINLIISVCTLLIDLCTRIWTIPKYRYIPFGHFWGNLFNKISEASSTS